MTGWWTKSWCAGGGDRVVVDGSGGGDAGEDGFSEAEEEAGEGGVEGVVEKIG